MLASSRPGGQRAALLLEWVALSGGQLAEDILRSWADGEHWLRLLTALFLHADWAHLLGNLVFLLIFGLPAERVMGPWRFLLLFLFGGCLANFVAVLALGAPACLLISPRAPVSAVNTGHTSDRER